jgi:hypothetical protein
MAQKRHGPAGKITGGGAGDGVADDRDVPIMIVRALSLLLYILAERNRTSRVMYWHW